MNTMDSNAQYKQDSTSHAKVSRDGTAGFYAPEPSEVPFIRVSGAGVSGLNIAPEMTHHEHVLAVQNGDIASMHSWELVTAVDGPGTRFTLFLSGCPLRCQYCHNPDTMKMLNGTTVTIDEIVARVKRYLPIFKATGGGLTVSGGEPMMQPAFLKRLLTAAKEIGVHTAVDTSGYLGMRMPPELIDNTDLFLLDIKSGNPKTYFEVTGRELSPTLKFSKHLQTINKAMWIRFVLVPNLTDDPDNVAAVADHVASLSDCVKRVEVLPFHNMGRDKWARAGLNYQLENTAPPSAELITQTKDIFKARGLTVF